MIPDIPASFLRWISVTYPGLEDQIDVSHGYDRTLCESENREMFLENFPPVGRRSRPSPEELRDFRAREADREDDDAADDVDLFDHCVYCGRGEHDENGLCADCTTRGYVVDVTSVPGHWTEPQVLSWYNGAHKQRTALRAILIDEELKDWRAYAITYQKQKVRR